MRQADPMPLHCYNDNESSFYYICSKKGTANVFVQSFCSCITSFLHPLGRAYTKNLNIVFLSTGRRSFQEPDEIFCQVHVQIGIHGNQVTTLVG